MFAMPNQTLAWSPAHGRGGRSTKSWTLNSNVMSSPMLQGGVEGAKKGMGGRGRSRGGRGSLGRSRGRTGWGRSCAPGHDESGEVMTHEGGRS